MKQTQREQILIGPVSLFTYDVCSLLLLLDNLVNSVSVPVLILEQNSNKICPSNNTESTLQTSNRNVALMLLQEASSSSVVKWLKQHSVLVLRLSICSFECVYIYKQALLLPVGQEVSVAKNRQ